jgi:peptide/nickel transport system permease protein
VTYNTTDRQTSEERPESAEEPGRRPIGRRPLTRARRLRLHGLKFADILALIWVVLLVIFVIAPGLIARYSPTDIVAPSFLPPSSEHWLGTDYLGRDLLSRIIYGTRRTLLGSVIAVVIGLSIGITLGLVAAYFARWVDAVIGRLTDVMLSIPGLLLSMVVVVALGFGEFSAAVAVGFANVATFSRLMRSEVLTVRNLQFVESSSHLGASRLRILLTHVLPNSYGSVLSLIALQFGSAIIWIASLSFLGYGAQPPNPEWGLLVAEGREYIISSPWLLYFPALAIVLSVLAISRLSHYIKRQVG